MPGIPKLIFWAIVLVGGYYGLNYVKVHTSADVVAYKRFAKAVLNADSHVARQVADSELVEAVIEKDDRRQELYNGVRILLTYYKVLSQNLTPDGNSSILVVEQISRVDSAGQPGFWGDREIRMRHTAKLEYENYRWRVTHFDEQ